MPFDPLLLVMGVLLAAFIFFQFRTSKKRKAEQETLQTQMVPGTEIMTQFGLYGTIVSIDDEKNEALIETTPGTVLRLHRQTILKVVADEAAAESEPSDAASDSDATNDGTATKGDA